MPSSHLLLAPFDIWVYNFSYHFSGIVGGYGLSQPLCSHCVGHHAIFLYGHSATGWRSSIFRSTIFCKIFENCRWLRATAFVLMVCTDIVQKSCDSGAVAMLFSQFQHGNRTSQCGLHTEAVRR